MKLDEDTVKKLMTLDWIHSNQFILFLVFYALMHFVLGIVFLSFVHYVAQNVFNSNFFRLEDNLNIFGLLITIYFGIIFRCILQFLNKKFGKKDYLK